MFLKIWENILLLWSFLKYLLNHWTIITLGVNVVCVYLFGCCLYCSQDLLILKTLRLKQSSTLAKQFTKTHNCNYSLICCALLMWQPFIYRFITVLLSVCIVFFPLNCLVFKNTFLETNMQLQVCVWLDI